MKKRIIVVIISICLVCLVCLSFYCNGVRSFLALLNSSEALGNTNNLMQIICSFCVVLGAIIGIWQYVLTSRAERNKINTDRVEKAIQLASYYKDEILPKLSILRYVFMKSQVLDILSKIKVVDMKDFTKEELQSQLSDYDSKKLETIMKSSSVIQAVIEAEVVFGLSLNVSQYISESEENGKKKINIEKPDAILMAFMGNIVTELLNNIEFFAMNFTHKVADETVVYQSLGKTYIEMIQLLYYDIRKNNSIGKQRLFTNAIELYHIWYERQKEQNAEVRTSTNKISKGTVLEG